jgi:hypothetical protein
MIRAAHEAGVRRLAMEALPWPSPDTPGPIRSIPEIGGYLGQPDMRRLIQAALDLGWTLWAYEAVSRAAAPAPRSMERTNWREREQAGNLCRLVAAAPGEPLLVWCGNSPASKRAAGEWVPMGWHFQAMSGIDQFVISQTVTVAFRGEVASWYRLCSPDSEISSPPAAARPASYGSRLPRRSTSMSVPTPWSSRLTMRSPRQPARQRRPAAGLAPFLRQCQERR